MDCDLIVHNANIYTVNPEFYIGEAMAVKDGKILEVGPEQQILDKYNAKETVDAMKRSVYPGFIDAHCHFLGYGLSLQEVNLVGTASFEEVIGQVVEFAQKHEGEWIVGRGWDQNDWQVKEYPDKTAIDSLFPNRPVWIRRVDGHGALANQAALDRAGITTETIIPGGTIEVRDGQLTGILIDASGPIRNIIAAPSVDDKKKALLAAQKHCFAVGLTTVDDAGLDKDDVEVIKALHKEGLLKMKMYVMLSDNEENLEHYLNSGPLKTDRLNVRSFKFYGDGALGSRGACLLEPYSDIIEQLHYGKLQKEIGYYEKWAKQLHEKGFQVNTHCIGDSANRALLNVYAKVLSGTNDKRWRIEHAQVIHPDDFSKFEEYNIIPSVQPTHATSDMYWAGDRLGPERVKGAYAYKYLLEANGLVALGTDFPVEGINPMGTFYAAVVRKDKKGWPEDGYQMENALSRKEALMGMTIWAAIANFEEDEKGSLEVGKSADFVILKYDIMEAPEGKLLKTPVIATYVNGEKVFGK